ncbi:hypothetical protein ILUMI_08178 [Ignelater luminosus]|uniref:RNA-directed DNA polymerase n=1 Tax=Ignelater luminosus TaxID=2038154 RepID=A0A8K0D822_IGNLU|nr:hypothetical protein ILUMI_08178 [Ignelater luminosus]
MHLVYTVQYANAIQCNLLHFQTVQAVCTSLQPGPILDRICKEAETTPVEEILETALKKEAIIREPSMVNKVDVRRKMAAGGKEKINNSYKTGGVARQEKQSKNEKKCNSCGETKHYFKNYELLDKYSDLFKEELGLYKGKQITLKIKNDAKLVFVKPRPMPFAFQNMVDEELKRLEELGVITLVDNTEWGTPLVPVIKKNGKIRLRADYKITVNKHLEDFKHPLSKIDELFQALQGGESFTKLDLSHAYNQLELSPETSNTKEYICQLDFLMEQSQHVAFIGMINFYGKFVPILSTILKPLYKLLRVESDTFYWNDECQQSFLKVISVISSNESLTHFDPNVSIKLVCNASNRGIEAVFVHVYSDSFEIPISFASRTLTKAKLGYSVIHKRSIVWAIQKFSQYLVGRHFTLCTDHKPLLAIFAENKGIPKMSAGRLQRWAVFLSEFDYTFKYIDGNSNVIADGLSRLPIREIGKHTNDYDYFHFLIEDKLPVRANDIRKELQRDTAFYKLLHIEQRLLMWGYRLIIPPKFRQQLLHEIHSAHNGVAKMKALARQYFWWPRLDNIGQYVKNCEACMKTANNPEKSRLVKFEVAKYTFDRIHIDFVGPFKGKTYLIIIDAYSKWPEVYEMERMDTETTLDKMRDCFSQFGLPNMIFSDNGTQFVSREFAYFCEMNGILHRTSSPCHPANNDDRNKNLRETPSKLMLGRIVETRLALLNDTVRDKMRERQLTYYYGRRDIEFEEGEMVYVKDYRGHKLCWKQIVKVGKFIDREEVKEGNDVVEKTFESVNVSSERVGRDKHAEPSIVVNDKKDKGENDVKLDNKVVVEFEAKEMAIEDSVSATDVCNSDHSTKQTSEPFIPNVLSRPKRNIRAPERLNL